MFDAGDGRDLAVEVEQRPVVADEIAAHGGMDAAVAAASAAELPVFASHAVHVCRRSAQVADDTVEAVGARQEPHLVEDGAFAAARYLFALMGGDGAEGTATETTAVDVDGVLDHLEGGYGASFLVFGMRESQVGQVEGGVDLVGGHRGFGWIDDHVEVAVPLQEGGALDLVAFLFDDMVVLGLAAFAFKTLLERVKLDGLGSRAEGGNIAGSIGHLRKEVAGFNAFPLIEKAGYFQRGPLPHAIVEQVGGGVDKDAWEESVVPIVVVRQTAHAGLDTGDDDRHVGVYLLQYAAVDVCSPVGPEARLAAGGIGVVVAEAPRCGVVVHHAIHSAACNSEKESGLAEFAEVAQVVPPVGLR